MSDNISLHIDPPKGVKETMASLMELVNAVDAFEKKLNSRARGSRTGLEEALAQLPVSVSKVAGALKGSMENLQKILSGEDAKVVNHVRQVNKALQEVFEQRLTSVGVMSEREIASWRKYGVSISGLQKAQLADIKTNAAAINAAQDLSLDRLRNASKAMWAAKTAEDKAALDLNEGLLKAYFSEVEAREKAHKDFMVAMTNQRVAEVGAAEKAAQEINKAKQEAYIAEMTAMEKARKDFAVAMTNQRVAEVGAAEKAAQEINKAKQEAYIAEMTAMEKARKDFAVAMTNQRVAEVGAAEKAAQQLAEGLQADMLKDELQFQTSRATIAEGLQADILKDELQFQTSRATIAEGLQADMLKDELQFQTSRATISEGLQADILKDEVQFQKSRASIADGLQADILKDEVEFQKARERYAAALHADMLRDEVRFQTERAAAANVGAAAVGRSNAAMNAVDFKTMNAGLRGLTQGFGMLSVGISSMLPFLASFAAGFSFMHTIKVGKEFEKSMFEIQELAGASTAQMDLLRSSISKLADSTQYKPTELAEGLSILSLAGLNANQALEALTPTLNFAAAGGVKLEQAASTLVAVGTAYGYSSDKFNTVADVIAKTAADTMSSVLNMSEAFKTSSVVAQQYGISLDDTARSLGMLAQIGITGSAAGTSYRNMITEFNKGTGKAADAIKALGIQVIDTDTGAAKPLMNTMRQLTAGLVTYSAVAQQRILQDMTTERGAKATAAYQAAALQHINKMVPTLQQEVEWLHKSGKSAEAKAHAVAAVNKAYDDMEEKLKKSEAAQAGMVFFANLEKQFKPMEQLGGIAASLQEAFLQTFKALEAPLFNLGQTIRELFKSDGFREGLTTVTSLMVGFVEGVVTATAFVIEHAKAVGLAIAAYVAFKTAVAAGLLTDLGVLIARYAGVTTAASAAAAASTAAAAATGQVSVASAIATAATTAWAAAMTWAAGAAGSLNVALGIAGMTLSVSAGAVLAVTAGVVALGVGIVALVGYWALSDTAAEKAIAKQRDLANAKAEAAKSEVKAIETQINLQTEQLIESNAANSKILQIRQSNATATQQINDRTFKAFQAHKNGELELEKKLRNEIAIIKTWIVSDAKIEEKTRVDAANARIDMWVKEKTMILEAIRLNQIWGLTGPLGGGKSIEEAESIANATYSKRLDRIKGEAEATKAGMAVQIRTAVELQAKLAELDKKTATTPKVFGKDGYEGTPDRAAAAKAGAEARALKAKEDALLKVTDAIEKFNVGTTDMEKSLQKVTAAETFEITVLQLLDRAVRAGAVTMEGANAIKKEITAAKNRRDSAEEVNGINKITEAVAAYSAELDQQLESGDKLTKLGKLQAQLDREIAEGLDDRALHQAVLTQYEINEAAAKEKQTTAQLAYNKAVEAAKKSSADVLTYIKTLKSQAATEAAMENARAAALARGPEFVAALEAETAVREKSAKAIEEASARVEELDRLQKDLEGPITDEQLENTAKAKKDLKDLVNTVDTLATAAGELAKKKWITIDNDRIAGDLASALMTGFKEGSDAGIRNLRDAITKEFLLKPIELKIKAVIGDVLASFSGGDAGGAAGNGLSTVANGASVYNMVSNGTAGIGANVAGVGSLVGSSSIAAYGAGMGLSTSSAAAAASAYTAAAAEIVGSNAALAATYTSTASALTAGAGTTSAFSTAMAAIPVWGWVALALSTQLGGPQIDKLGSGIQGTLGGKKGSNLAGYDVYKEDHHGIFGIGAFTTENREWKELDAGISGYVDAAVLTVTAATKGYANAIGMSAEAVDGFTKSIDISLVGLNPDQQKAAIDKAIADYTNEMVTGAYGQALMVFAKQGETASTTLQRVATEFMAVNQTLEAFGYTLLDVGTAGVKASQSLIEAMGGIANFQSQMQAVYQGYYTKAEQDANVITHVIKNLEAAGLNISSGQVSSREGVRGLLDKYSKGVGTKEGDKAYAAVVAAALALDKILPPLKKLTSESSAASIALHKLPSPSNAAAGAMRQVGGAAMSLVGSLEAASSRASSLFASIGSLLSGLGGEGEEGEEGSSGSEGRSSGNSAAVAAQNALADAGDAIMEFVNQITSGTVEELKNSRLSFLLSQAQYRSDLAKAQEGDLEASQNIVKSAEAYLNHQISRSTTATDARRATQLMANELRALPASNTEHAEETGAKGLVKAMNKLTAALRAALLAVKELLIAINEAELSVNSRELLIAAAEAILSAIEAVKGANISVGLKIEAYGVLEELAKTITVGVQASWLDDDLKGLLGVVGKNIALAVEISVKSAHGEASIKEAIDLLKTTTTTLNMIVTTQDMDPVVRRLAMAGVDGIAIAVQVAMSTPGMSKEDITTVMGILTTADKVINLIINSTMPDDVKAMALGTTDTITKSITLAITGLTGEDKDLVFATTDTLTKNLELAVSSNDQVGIALINQESLALEAILKMTEGELSPEVREILQSGDLEKLVHIAIRMKADDVGVQLAAIESAFNLELDLSVGDTTAITAAVENLKAVSTLTIMAILEPGNVEAEIAGLREAQQLVVQAHLDAGDTPEQIAALVAAQGVTITATLDVAAATEAKAIITMPQMVELGATLDTTSAQSAKDLVTAAANVFLSSTLDTAEATAAKTKIMEAALVAFTATLDGAEAAAFKAVLASPAFVDFVAQFDSSAATAAKDALIGAADTAITANLDSGAATAAKDAVTADATLTVVAVLEANGYAEQLAAMTAPVTQHITIVTTNYVETVNTVRTVTVPSAQGNVFVPSALGNMFVPSSLTAYALGGLPTNSVVSSPLFFDMGLAGEAGPEAIMPLKRGADGNLGVRASFGQPKETPQIDYSKYNSGKSDALIAEIKALREDNKQMRYELQAIAGHTGKTSRLIDRAMPDGDALATRTAA